MVLSRNQTEVLRQALAAAGGSSTIVVGTGMLVAQSEASANPATLISSTVVVRGITVFKRSGSALNLRFSDSSELKIALGAVAAGDTITWLFPEGVRFTDHVEVIASAVLDYSIFYTPG